MSRRRSLFSVFLALLLVVFAFLPIKASAEGISDSCYDFVCKGIESYYQNKDLGVTNDLSCYFSEDILPLLNAKIEMDGFQRQTYGLEYKDYQINISPIFQDQWYEDENGAYYLIQVERIWYYSSDPTTMSEVLEITVSKNEDEEMCIIGCYNQTESITYGPIDDIFKNAQMTRADITMDTVLDAYVDDFKEQCIEKEHQMEMDMQSDLNKDVEVLSSTTLSRTKIKEWARNNYNQDSPSSSDSSISYYDFSQISGAYDCTNFVSHALLAGGATMHDNGKSGIQGTDQWYYRSTANRSSSWAGVKELYTFLTRSNPSDSNIGPYATEKTLTYANAYTGDIVQGHNGNTWRHSTVVTKFENNQVYVTGRTSPGQYNDNALATSIYGTQRLLHLEGNYSK